MIKNKYNPEAIETRWQARWEIEKPHRPEPAGFEGVSESMYVDLFDMASNLPELNLTLKECIDTANKWTRKSAPVKPAAAAAAAADKQWLHTGQVSRERRLA